MPPVTAITDIFNNDLSRMILAVLLIIGTLVLLFQHDDVPSFLIALDGAAVGFFFGGLAPVNSGRRS